MDRFLPNNTQCKMGQLVQKFVPRSRVGIFRNECTRYTPLDSKLLFLCNLSYSGAFGTIWLPYKTRCKTGQNWRKSSCHKVASEFFAMKAPDPTHWTLNSCFGAFCTIWVHLGLFGCHTTLSLNGSNWCKSSCHEISLDFSNEHPRSSPLDPKLMFSCVSYYLGAFGTVWLRNNT